MVKQLLIILLCATSAYAMSVELQWDANKESNLAGYKAYARDMSVEGSSFTLLSTVHKQTMVRLENLSSAHKYIFVVTAYNSDGHESTYSNKVYVGLPVKQMKLKTLRGSIR
jgi:hypothetical protein